MGDAEALSRYGRRPLDHNLDCLHAAGASAEGEVQTIFCCIVEYLSKERVFSNSGSRI